MATQTLFKRFVALKSSFTTHHTRPRIRHLAISPYSLFDTDETVEAPYNTNLFELFLFVYSLEDAASDKSDANMLLTMRCSTLGGSLEFETLLEKR